MKCRLADAEHLGQSLNEAVSAVAAAIIARLRFAPIDTAIAAAIITRFRFANAIAAIVHATVFAAAIIARLRFAPILRRCGRRQR